MTNVSSWLRGQRKSELVELAVTAGLTEYVACLSNSNSNSNSTDREIYSSNPHF